MAFKKYQKPHELQAKVIREYDGMFIIGRDVIEEFHLQGSGFCTLYFDTDTCQVGFEFSVVRLSGAMCVQGRGRSFGIPGGSFMRKFCIDPEAVFAEPSKHGDLLTIPVKLKEDDEI